jgi:hypothetical protein
MRLYHLAFTLLVVLASSTPFAQAEWAGEKSGLGDNAALQYWQAFAHLPVLDEQQQKLLDDWRTVSLDDPEVKKIIDQSHKSMTYLRRASRIEKCDWGLEYNDGIAMLLPHLAKARDLARIAALYSRNQCEQGNGPALQANAMAMMTMARHIAKDPIMICLLVRYLIEGLTVDLIAPYVPEGKAPYDHALAAFESLPPAPDLRDCIQAEKTFFVEWMIRKFQEEEDREAGASVKLWHQMIGPNAPKELKAVGSYREMVTLTSELPPVYDELLVLTELPKSQFEKKYPEFKKRVSADNELVRFYLPDVESLQAKEQRNTARIAMLLAGIAVAESGPERLKDLKDPFGDRPFEYRAVDNGFELESKLEYEGKPVTLTLGGRPSE